MYKQIHATATKIETTSTGQQITEFRNLIFD